MENAALSGTTILHVEDDPDQRMLVRATLGRSGASVRGAADGREGLDAARCNDIDVVILDLGLPELSGFDVARSLRLEGCKLPLLALSSWIRDLDPRLLAEAGFDAWLPKPFSPDQLRQLVGRFRRPAS